MEQHAGSSRQPDTQGGVQPVASGNHLSFPGSPGSYTRQRHTTPRSSLNIQEGGCNQSRPLRRKLAFPFRRVLSREYI